MRIAPGRPGLAEAGAATVGPLIAAPLMIAVGVCAVSYLFHSMTLLSLWNASRIEGHCRAGQRPTGSIVACRRRQARPKHKLPAIR